jgi:hypothetical protein
MFRPNQSTEMYLLESKDKATFGLHRFFQRYFMSYKQSPDSVYIGAGGDENVGQGGSLARGNRLRHLN